MICLSSVFYSSSNISFLIFLMCYDLHSFFAHMASGNELFMDTYANGINMCVSIALLHQARWREIVEIENRQLSWQRGILDLLALYQFTIINSYQEAFILDN